MSQQPVRGQNVVERAHPDYDPIGARLGAFTFYPYVGGSLLFDDNVFFTPSDRTADLIAATTFGLRAQTELSNFTLRLDTGGQIVRYLETTSQNYWSAHFSADARYAIDPGLSLFGQVEAVRDAQPRDAVDAVNSLTPTIYYDAHATIGVTKNAGRFNLAASTAYERLQYTDSEGANHTTIDNAPLNRNQWTFDGLVGYNYVGTSNAFFRVQANVRQYPVSVNDAGFRDSSTGFAVSVGGDFDFGVITGRVEVGYGQQAYDDSQIGTVAGPLAHIEVLWNPTGLTSVTGTFDYDYEEAINNASPGYWRSLLGVTVAHELRRNIILTGNLGYLNRQFVNSSQVENRAIAGLGGRYLIDNGLVLDGHYQFSLQRSNESASDFVVNAVFVQLRKTF